tara:strand:- start:245 stop:1843 length:1599 start_codon:yes stop_codon:yes gene_type:complete
MNIRKINIELLARLFFIFFGLLYFFTQIVLLIGFSLTKINCLIIAISSIVISNFILKIKRFLFYNSISIIVLLICFLLINQYIDLTWDGQAYHQEITLRLADGWNPIKTKVSNIWVYHYPKSYETLGVFFYDLFGTVKAIKVTNIIFFIILFLYSNSYLKKHFNKKETFIYSLIITFNPVFLGQLTSNLIDGFLYAIVVILVISYLNIKKKSNYRIDFILAIIILINIKFTGLVFAFFISAYILVNEYLIAKSRTIKIKEFIFLTILIIPFLYSPYIKNNYLEKGHPLYPVMGDNNFAFIDNYEPDIIKPYHRINKVLISNFTTVTNRKEGEFKIPFTFSIRELQRFRNGNPRLGSFGVWWSGILIFSIFFYAYYVYIHRKKFKLSDYEYIIAVIIFITLINKGGWWFRYTPFIWLIPLLLFLSIKRYQKSKKAEITFSLIVFINGLLTLSISFGAIYLDTKRFEKKLLNLKSKNINSLKIDFGAFYGNKTLLKEYDISYVEAKKETFKEIIMFNSEVAMDTISEKKNTLND